MRIGAEIAVFVTRRGGGEVLLVHRVPTRGDYWHVVAGGVEPGETAGQAAARELEEETGLTADVGLGLAVTEYVDRLTEGPAARGAEHAVSAVSVRVDCFGVEAPPDWEPTLDGEHDDHRWCEPAEAARALRWPATAQALERLLLGSGFVEADRQVIIRLAAPDEHERLREVAIASRGVWGYDEERFRQWASSLDVSAERLRDNETYVAEDGARLVGWASLRSPADGVCVLDELWVEPERIRSGVGSQLFRFILSRSRNLGASQLEWGAEPGAVGFYEKMGGRFLRTKRSSSFDLVIPVMSIDL
jgi:8-oxo-dGTP pyrophosphatase MutT (NUDIX family)